MKITYIFRHPSVGFSIQRVFQTINEGVGKACETKEIFLPSQFSNIFAMIKNGLYVAKNTGGINHVTGDAHYLLYFLKKKNTVVTVHDIMYYSYISGFKKKIWKLLYINSLKKAKKVIFISDFAKEQVLDEIHLPKSQYSIIPNPVSPDFSFKEKKFNKEKPVILHIGARMDRKNLGRTIMALVDVPCHLRIIGKISSKNLALLEQYGTEYTNAYDLSNAEIVQEYENCDIVNFPSLFEGFGMPIIEGQAVGRPVITSNIEPMKQVAGESAVLVDPESVASIREGYLKMIEDDEFREGIIEKGLNNVKQYQLEHISNRYLTLYRELLEQ